MANSLHDQKLSRRFELLDASHNGYLEKEDFVGLARRVVKSFVKSEDSPKGRAVLENAARLWEKLIKPLDSDGDGRVDKKEFVSGIEQRVIEGGEYDRTFRPIVEASIALADTDGDGRLNRAEFIRLFLLYGLSEEEAAESFVRVDVDHDGEITVDELASANRQFYLSSDPGSAGNLLYGHL